MTLLSSGPDLKKGANRTGISGDVSSLKCRTALMKLKWDRRPIRRPKQQNECQKLVKGICIKGRIRKGQSKQKRNQSMLHDLRLFGFPREPRTASLPEDHKMQSATAILSHASAYFRQVE
jgi:hypothetical protein